jgi:hypothetical protein
MSATAGAVLAHQAQRRRRVGGGFDGGALPPFVLDILAAGGLLPRLAREGYVPLPGP